MFSSLRTKVTLCPRGPLPTTLPTLLSLELTGSPDHALPAPFFAEKGVVTSQVRPSAVPDPGGKESFHPHKCRAPGDATTTARAAATQPDWPRGVLAVLSAAEGGRKTPGTLPSPPPGKRSLPPPSAGHKDTSVVCEQAATWPKGAETWQVGMLHAAEEAKSPWGPVPICPRGKSLPDPKAGTGCSLSIE